MDARFSFDQGETSHHCFELLYWIKKTQRVVSFLKPIYPADQNNFKLVLFGGLCQRRILIGHEEGILEYRINNNQLCPVLHQTLNNSQIDRTRKYCVTDDVIVICGGEKYDNVQNRKVEILTFSNTKDQKLTKRKCPTLLPFDINEDRRLFYLGHNRLLLFGATRYYYCDTLPRCQRVIRYPLKTGKLVFEGIINNVKDNIIWKEVGSLNTSRIATIIFKMKNYVYVAGGKSRVGNGLVSCERLNLITYCWEQTVYSLPSKISAEHSSVVVNADESEAIIFGCKCLVFLKCNCNYVIAFNENKGFSVVQKEIISNKIQCSNTNHVSIAL